LQSVIIQSFTTKLRLLARALVHQPKILILDEPTAGVDVEIRRSMWSYLKELNRSGVTIILTTQIVCTQMRENRKISLITMVL
jgi:ABC-2 type transport system ATP-binding protein